MSNNKSDFSRIARRAIAYERENNYSKALVEWTIAYYAAENVNQRATALNRRKFCNSTLEREIRDISSKIKKSPNNETNV